MGFVDSKQNIEYHYCILYIFLCLVSNMPVKQNSSLTSTDYDLVSAFLKLKEVGLFHTLFLQGGLLTGRVKDFQFLYSGSSRHEAAWGFIK